MNKRQVQALVSKTLGPERAETWEPEDHTAALGATERTRQPMEDAMRKADQIEAAARRFFNLMMPTESWNYSDHPAKALIEGAFRLYQHSWDGFDIRKWEWPIDALMDDRADAFDGNEPWAVLFRAAYQLRDWRKSRAA